MRPLTTIPQLKGKRVLIRVDYNVPLKGSKIVDARRIESSYKTIDVILKKGGVPVLLAHLGDGKESLAPIARFLSKRYKKLLFLKGPIEGGAREWVLSHSTKGTVILLENLRRSKGETGNSVIYARALAALGEVYVNDAFSVSHRAHASVVGLPKLLPSYAGYQLMREIAALSPVVSETVPHPFLFILGGAKFDTKIPLIKRFIERADGVVIAGAILNTFYKAAGYTVGKSVVESGFEKTIAPLLASPALLLPTDVVVTRGTAALTLSVDEVQKGDVIVDIGKESIARIAEKIAKAKLVVWNGPTGWYEKGYTKGTVSLARAIAQSRARAVIGGGDTTAVLEKMLQKIPTNKRIFISTGGGATLEYLSRGALPGIEALG